MRQSRTELSPPAILSAYPCHRVPVLLTWREAPRGPRETRGAATIWEHPPRSIFGRVLVLSLPFDASGRLSWILRTLKLKSEGKTNNLTIELAFDFF